MITGKTWVWCLGGALSVGILLLITFTFLRKEKPVVPEVKQAKIIEIAPTPLLQTVSNTLVHPITFTNKTSDSTLPGQKGRTRHVFTAQEQAAARAKMEARRQAFAKKLFAEQLEKTQLVYAQEQKELEMKEVELREKDPLVKEAYAKMMASRNEYEEACAKTIPGYADQVTEAGRLRASLEDVNARKGQGGSADALEVAEIRKKLNLALSNISRLRTEQNPTGTAVGKAFIKVMEVQSAYLKFLSQNEEYKQAKNKADATMSEINKLTSM